MARIKPQTLLQQSKKKKGPTRISLTNIILCNLVVVLIVLCVLATYRHLGRSRNTSSDNGLMHTEDSEGFMESKKSDVPSYATLITSKGSIILELFKDASPEILEKFLHLCHQGHFKGMLFRRVIKNYVVQAGDSQGVGTSEDWTMKIKPHNQLVTSPKHEAFMLGTSKTKKDGRGFDLFITTAPIPDLSDKLIVFGQVFKGEDVVQEIEEVDTDQHYQPKSRIEIIDIILKQER